MREEIAVRRSVSDELMLLRQRVGTCGGCFAGRGLDRLKCLGVEGFGQSQSPLLAERGSEIAVAQKILGEGGVYAGLVK